MWRRARAQHVRRAVGSRSGQIVSNGKTLPVTTNCGRPNVNSKRHIKRLTMQSSGREELLIFYFYFEFMNEKNRKQDSWLLLCSFVNIWKHLQPQSDYKLSHIVTLLQAEPPMAMYQMVNQRTFHFSKLCHLFLIKRQAWCYFCYIICSKSLCDYCCKRSVFMMKKTHFIYDKNQRGSWVISHSDIGNSF